MHLYGFGDFLWDTAAGTTTSTFWFSPKDGVVWVNSVEPQILLRPGTYPTFGLSQIGAMTIGGVFGYRVVAGDAYGGNSENAFIDLFKRLNPANAVPRPLYAQRNDGQLIVMQAILSVPNFSSESSINTRDAAFVVASPPTGQAALTGSKVFS